MREGVCVWVGGVGVQGDGRVVGVGVDVGVCVAGRLLQVKDSGQERWMGGKEQMFQSLESAWAG